MLGRSPLRLTQLEAGDHCRQLGAVRDDLATRLGALVMAEPEGSGGSIGSLGAAAANALGGSSGAADLRQLQAAFSTTLAETLGPHSLPSRWERAWPWLVFGTPLLALGARSLLSRSNDIRASVQAMRDVVSGFVTEWIITPLRSTVQTITSGSQLSVASPKSLEAELDSLERMYV